MLRFFASDWNRIIRELEELIKPVNLDVLKALVKGDGEKIARPLDRIAESSEKLGLRLSASYAKELASRAREIVDPATAAGKYIDVEREVSILRKRIDDELRDREFFAFEASQIEYFDRKNLFGDEVAIAFPSALVNIEEAGKCLALDRSTACVFHLMRVMETGLMVIGKALGIPYAPSWESYLRQIDDRVQKKWKSKSIRWKRDEPFFKDVSAHLHSVKNAWRNPTMHIVRDYTPEQAEEIFQAVGVFMRHLATRLHE
jgi:hypothetical protein